LYGTLFLTTGRLIWMRWRLSPPFARRIMEVPLEDIERFVMRRRWWMRPITVLQIDRRSQTRVLRFAPLWGRPEAEDWIAVMEQIAESANIIVSRET